MRSGEIPDTELGRRILHSYSPYVGWAIWMNFGAFQFPATKKVPHYSSFAYDRHVPLDFYGAMFVPGTYHDRVAPVDIAATFASIPRVNQPSSVEGHVLTQVLRPDTGSGFAPHTQTQRRKGRNVEYAAAGHEGQRSGNRAALSGHSGQWNLRIRNRVRRACLAQSHRRLRDQRAFEGADAELTDAENHRNCSRNDQRDRVAEHGRASVRGRETP